MNEISKSVFPWGSPESNMTDEEHAYYSWSGSNKERQQSFKDGNVINYETTHKSHFPALIIIERHLDRNTWIEVHPWTGSFYKKITEERAKELLADGYKILKYEST